MTQPARLTGGLLARKGEAFPAGGFARAGLTLGSASRVGRVVAIDSGQEVDGAVASPGGGMSGRGPATRVALTVRLDPERHIRLKIFGATHRRTCQDVIVQALDAYLRSCGADCACTRHALEDCARN